MMDTRYITTDAEKIFMYLYEYDIELDKDKILDKVIENFNMIRYIYIQDNNKRINYNHIKKILDKYPNINSIVYHNNIDNNEEIINIFKLFKKIRRVQFEYLNLKLSINLDNLFSLLDINKVHTLELYSTDLSNNIIYLSHYLKTNKFLEKISLYSCNIEENVKYLADAIKENNTLLDINLCENKLDNNIRYIAEALEINTSIEILNLSSTSIGSNIIYIANMLKVNKTLREIYLRNNNIQEYIVHLADALRYNTSLWYIYISNNGLSNIKDKKLIEKTQNFIKINRTLVLFDLTGDGFGPDIDINVGNFVACHIRKVMILLLFYFKLNKYINLITLLSIPLKKKYVGLIIHLKWTFIPNW